MSISESKVKSFYSWHRNYKVYVCEEEMCHLFCHRLHALFCLCFSLKKKQALLALSQLHRKERGHFRKSCIVCVEDQLTWPLKGRAYSGCPVLLSFWREDVSASRLGMIIRDNFSQWRLIFSHLSSSVFFLSQERTNLQIIWGESRDSEGNGWLKDLDTA